MTHRTEIAALAFVLLAGLVGCDEGPKVKAEDLPDAGKNQAVMDKNIQDAVQSAAVMPSAAATADTGPPASGVFAPGDADKAHMPGAPASVEVIAAGSAPLQNLTPTAGLAKPKRFMLSIARTTMPGGPRPVVDYVIEAKLAGQQGEGKDAKAAKKPAEAAPSATASAAAAPPAPIPAKRPLVFTVVKATPAQQQPGALPEGFTKLLKSVEGSQILATLTPNGAILGEQARVSKDMNPGLQEFVEVLTEVLGLFMSPMPAEPVGVGGYWIAADRAKSAGINVMRYRVTKVEQMKGDEVAFSLDLRQYAVSQDEHPSMVKAGAIIVGMNARGKATFVRKRGELLPITGELKAPMVVQLANPQQPQAAQPIQYETTVRLTPLMAAEEEKPPAK